MHYLRDHWLKSCFHFGLQTSPRLMALLVCLVAILTSGLTGCVGGIGPGCHHGNCYDCDGTAGRPIAYGPLDGLRQMRRQLACGGGGCGEVYVGEWISTPPHVHDPCCGEQFVGGASFCRPFCWQPGSILSSLRLSGRLSDGCGSGGCCECDGCHAGYHDEYFSHGAIDGPIFHDGVSSGGAGCSTCANSSANGMRMAGRHSSVPTRPSGQPQRLARSPQAATVPRSNVQGGPFRQAQRPAAPVRR